MLRIPNGAIDLLKKNISLERVIEAQGLKLQRNGVSLIGFCPFHDDCERSLIVIPSSNTWRCLAGCHTGGTVIDWVMKSRGVSFWHAAELLRNEHPSLATPLRVVAKGMTAAVKLEPLFQPNADDQRVLQDILR
jgi:DNA primase